MFLLSCLSCFSLASFPPIVLSSLLMEFINLESISPKTTSPALVTLCFPDNNKSWILSKDLFLWVAVLFSTTVFHAGKIASIFLSNSLEVCWARFRSADLIPSCFLSISKNSWVFPLLALKPEAILSNSLSILLSANLSSLPLVASFLSVCVVPPRTPVNNAPSVPNLTLLINSLAAS